jgi:membrane-associated phospholipid phosphatase
MHRNLARRAKREPIDFTFYGVNLFLAGMNLVLSVFAGAGGTGVATAGTPAPDTATGVAVSAGRHLAVAAAFLSACALPWLLSLLEDHLEGRPRAARIGRFMRTFYVHAFYGPYFAEVIILSQLVWGGSSIDPLVAAAEKAVFGFQPALAFSAALSHLRALNELFFFGYFSYYLIITTGFWVMFFRGYDAAARRAVFIATTSFAVLYVWYVFVPVQGPKYFFESLNRAWYGEFEGYLIVPFMRAIFNNMNLAGAAFPSSHVAIGLIAAGLIRRHLPRLFWVYAGLFVLLCLSTVYIYAHYAIDIFAGIVAVFPLLWIARPLYRRAKRLTATRGADARGAAPDGPPSTSL